MMLESFCGVLCIGLHKLETQRFGMFGPFGPVLGLWSLNRQTGKRREEMWLGPDRLFNGPVLGPRFPILGVDRSSLVLVRLPFFLYAPCTLTATSTADNNKIVIFIKVDSRFRTAARVFEITLRSDEHFQ